jgi:hypothetical protein
MQADDIQDMGRDGAQNTGHVVNHDAGQEKSQKASQTLVSTAGELPIDGRRHFALMQQTVQISKHFSGRDDYMEASADIRAELMANKELLRGCSAPDLEQVLVEFTSAVMSYLSSTVPSTASPALIFSPIDLDEECRLTLRADECRVIAQTSADPDVDRALGGLYDAVAILGRAMRSSPEPGILIVHDLEAPMVRGLA